MNEKRFFTKINKNGRLVIIDKECHTELIDLTLACEVLNRLDLKLKTYNEQLGEQQATINKQLDQIIELQDKYRILEFNHSRLEKRNKAQYEKIGEQQATIQSLKEENRKLRNIHLSIDLTYSYGYGRYLADVRVIDDE